MSELQKIRTEINALVDKYAQNALRPAPFIAGQSPIPPSGKLIDAQELKMMVEASLDGWLTTGRFNDAFEKQLAQFLGVKHVITVNSGSSANLVAFSALTSPKLGSRAIQPGDEVIGVAAVFPTTVNPILQFGAIPVFVDVELGTYNIDVSKLEAAISPKTKAIMLAHTLGNPFDLDTVQALEVIKNDNQIDQEFEGMMRKLITYMMEDPRTISASIDLVFVAKAIERVGDHAKNLAEQIIYIVKGTDVRHNPVETVETVALTRS